VNDLHKAAGARLSFNGATGQQEMGVTGQFLDGSQKRLDSAVGMNGKGIAMDNHFDTLNDHFTSFDRNMGESFNFII
jgi:hypothetical protein